MHFCYFNTLKRSFLKLILQNFLQGGSAPLHPRAQKGVIDQAPPSSPPCNRAVPWSKHLFSPSNIPQLDGAESFSSEKELYIQASNPTVAPLGQHDCQCSQLPPFSPIQPILPPTHVKSVNNKPVSSSSLPQKPTKQIQSTPRLAPLQPVYLPLIPTLPWEDEPEPEQQAHELDEQGPEQEQQQNEPTQYMTKPLRDYETMHA